MLFEDNAPSWPDLEALVAEREASLGCGPEDLETGPTDPQSLKRTFGKSDRIRVHLYRDHAAWCPYCQKV
jgi:glutathione S-transferase